MQRLSRGRGRVRDPLRGRCHPRLSGQSRAVCGVASLIAAVEPTRRKRMPSLFETNAVPGIVPVPRTTDVVGAAVDSRPQAIEII